MSDFLKVSRFKDYCPNGLQVEGKPEIKRILLGVTACQALIDVAVERQMDAIIVHHGLFWKGDSQALLGINKKRIKSLLTHDINLYAYHLPLDCHEGVGNNAQIAKELPVTNIRSHSVGGIEQLLWTADLITPQTIDSFHKILDVRFNQKTLYLGQGGRERIKKIAWCSGGAQKYIIDAKALGAEVYFSGEVSEQTMHLAKEHGIHYFSCGHHATERFGVQALAEHLKREFSVQCVYYDVYNPV